MGRRNEIPITLNRHVQDEIDSFTVGREKDFFLEAYAVPVNTGTNSSGAEGSQSAP